MYPQDAYHARAVTLSRTSDPMITTQWVMSELLAFFSRTRFRSAAADWVTELESQGLVIPADPAEFEAGLGMYRQFTDKRWSLVDCISFEVMRRHGVTEALTADRDFEQAGFRALLAAT